MVSRRQFLRGGLPAPSRPLRPPGAVDGPEFIDACCRCGDCVSVCPSKIVTLDSAGFPVLDFSLGACRFCARCQQVCTTGALRPQGAAISSAWMARVGSACLAFGGVECRVCGDACEVTAIHFHPRLGAAQLPEVMADLCTGCGACVSVCPQQAVTIQPR